MKTVIWTYLRCNQLGIVNEILVWLTHTPIDVLTVVMGLWWKMLSSHRKQKPIAGLQRVFMLEWAKSMAGTILVLTLRFQGRSSPLGALLPIVGEWLVWINQICWQKQ